MKDLPIAVGRIKLNINCKEDEEKDLLDISKVLNKEVNTLSLETGRLSDIILLVSLLFIKTNQITNKIDNFEESMIEILKNITPFLENANKQEELEEKLVLLNILKENELRKKDLNEKIPEKKISITEHYKEMTELIEVITEHIEKLANNLKGF